VFAFLTQEFDTKEDLCHKKETKRMNVRVDQDVCVGSGNCEATAPQVFKVKDGKSHVIVDTVPEDQEEKVREAVNGCPSGAISAA
jgi:ferredoxin